MHVCVLGFILVLQMKRQDPRTLSDLYKIIEIVNEENHLHSGSFYIYIVVSIVFLLIPFYYQ